MKIILAENAGFCFGVKRAVDLTLKTLEDKQDNIYCLGPLIHNNQVIEYLNSLGLEVVKDINKMKKGKVIIRSHGVSYNTHKLLKEKGLTIVDSTCPFVKKIHNIVKKYSEDGYTIIIIGDSSHPEVMGINGWCNNKAIIINEIEDIKQISSNDNICIVSQTTNTLEKFEKLCDAILKKTSNVKIFNTICNATTLRQKSCKEVASKVDVMIVIGGYHSSNTKKLYGISKKYCKNVYHIETIKDLPIKNLKKYDTIGITAGASTPDWIIKEVIQKMQNIENAENIEKEDMMKAIEDSLVQIHRGEIVKGTVISMNEDEVMVNLGYKSDGIVKREELSNDPEAKPNDLFKEGDEIESYVIKLDDGEGNVLLSIKKVQNIKGWDEVEELYKNKDKIDCKVIEVVKGGVIALIKGLRGFIPASQISVRYVKNLDSYLGKILKVEIIDFDKNKKRIILSRKEIEKEEIEEKKEKLWSNLKIDSIIDGKVKKITDFGCFVDIGGIDGLIHISDLSWKRIKHPSEIVKEGDNIKVKVLNFDKEKERISLGLKQITKRPWELFLDKYKIGNIIEGKVVNLVDFGAFIELDVGVDGLVHISQISNEHVKKPSDKLTVGQTIKAKIIDIKEDEEKISLSIKEADEDEIMKDSINNENEDMDITVEDFLNNKN